MTVSVDSPASVAYPRDGGPVRTRPRRWVVVVAVTWGIILAAGIGWAWATGGPTAREQTTVAQARPVVDQAVARVVEAATADGLAVAAISGFDRVGGCSVTVVRAGERYQRVVTVVVAPGTEQALLSRVAARLPAAYGAKAPPVVEPYLVADAGFWVSLTGSVAGPGQVRIVADTGSCRPPGDLAEAADAGAAPTPGDAAEAALRPVLARLEVAAPVWHTHAAGCPDGGHVSTAETSGISANWDLDEALRGLGSETVVSTSDLYAIDADGVGIAVRVDNDGHLVATATTGCGRR